MKSVNHLVQMIISSDEADQFFLTRGLESHTLKAFHVEKRQFYQWALKLPSSLTMWKALVKQAPWNLRHNSCSHQVYWYHWGTCTYKQNSYCLSTFFFRQTKRVVEICIWTCWIYCDWDYQWTGSCNEIFCSFTTRIKL